MIKRVFNQYWGNIPEKMVDTKSFVWLYLFLAVSFPLSIILIYRVNVNFILLFYVAQVISFLIAPHIHRQIRTGNNVLQVESQNILYRLSAFFGVYVLLPILIMFTKVVLISFVQGMFTNSNPQGLGTVSNENLKTDILSSILASSEEVWRIAIIFVIYLILLRLFPNKKPIYKWIYIFIGVIISSFMFGWIHTFGYTSSWFSFQITVVLGVTGMVYAAFIFITRRFIVVMIAHGLYDVMNTLLRSLNKDIVDILPYIFIASLILSSYAFAKVYDKIKIGKKVTDLNM